MKRQLPLLFLLLLLVACGADKRSAIGQTEVLIETSEGDIVVRLYDDTPLHRDNFIRLVEQGAYDGVLFNRVVPDMVIQAGDTTLKVLGKAAGSDGSAAAAVAGRSGERGGRRLPAEGIPAEILCPRHFHKQGALAAAREPDSINPGRQSSTLQWYIVTGKKYTLTELAELQAVMYDARVAARFNALQRERAAELQRLRATDHAAYQELLGAMQVEAEEAIAAAPPRPFTDAQKQAYTKQGGAPHLDGDYTVFGEVVDGMPVALRIGRVPTDDRERPRRAVSIRRMSVRK